METPKYYQLTPEPIEVIQGWGCYESNSFSIMHRIILLKCELNYEAFSSVWYNCI